MDGTNPEDEGRQMVSRFFRSQQIDPYKLEHAMMNDYKRWLLLEIQEKGRGTSPKAVKLGMERLANQRRFELQKLRRECPLSS